MSMKPGATTMPCASIFCFALACERLPIAATLPSRIPMSPKYQGEPVPSMTWPWVMITSNDGCCATQQRNRANRKSDIERTRKRRMGPFLASIFCNQDSQPLQPKSSGHRGTKTAASPSKQSADHDPHCKREPLVPAERARNTWHKLHQDHR